MYLIEELHENKGIEDDCVMLGGALYAAGLRHTKQLRSMEDQAVHDSQLEQTLPYNVLGDLRRYIAVSLLLVKTSIKVPFSMRHEVCCLNAASSAQLQLTQRQHMCCSLQRSTAVPQQRHCILYCSLC